jgi:hypothetical protein
LDYAPWILLLRLRSLICAPWIALLGLHALDWLLGLFSPYLRAFVIEFLLLRSYFYALFFTAPTIPLLFVFLLLNPVALSLAYDLTCTATEPMPEPRTLLD